MKQLILATVAAIASSAAYAQSLNCHQLRSPAEIEVCMGNLTDLDHRLRSAYSLALRQAGYVGARLRLETDQRAWLYRRDRSGANLDCLGEAYWSRLKDLGDDDADN